MATPTPTPHPGAAAALSLADARAIVLAATRQLDVEQVELAHASGRVLARDVHASTDVPPFDNSAMDGFAVTAGDAGRKLTIADESRAGAPALHAVTDSTAIRISTGAQLPAGAAAVAPIERVGEDADTVTLLDRVRSGQNVRRAGEDMHKGDLVLRAGARIGAAQLAAAAAAGSPSLICSRRPRLAIVATGDELVAPGQPLAPGQIYDSNAIALETLATSAGATVTDTLRAGDDARATRDTIDQALQDADVLLISGGVSVGPHDHVKPALHELGVQERFWRVALKPGKPTWFGTNENKLVFGLPGNPVSAFVTFLLFARPALAALQGADPMAARTTAVLTTPLPRLPERTEAVRVSLTHTDGALRATPTGPQGSHVVTSLLAANGLAIVDPGDGSLEAGATVIVELI